MNTHSLISMGHSKISPEDHDENWPQDASDAYTDSLEISDHGKYHW